MKPLSLARIVACALVPLVSACGIPDLVAHGVKSYEKSQEKGQAQPVMAQPQPVERAPAVVRDSGRYDGEAVPVPAAAVPRAEKVVVEQLK